MSMIQTRKDLHQKSAGAFMRGWLKVDDKIAANVPTVMWKELVGSLLVITGAGLGVALASFVAMQLSGVLAFVVWLVVSAIACSLGVWPGKILLHGTRCRVAAVVIVWLIPVLVIGTIAVSVVRLL